MSSLARIEELEKKYADSPRRFFAPLANEIRKAGNPTRAIELCRTHLSQQPNHMSGQVVLGQALFDAGQLAEARDAFEAALVLDPENLIALRHLGDMAREFGDFEGARKWYSRVLDVDSRNHDVIAALREVDDLIAASALGSPAPAAGVEHSHSDDSDSPYKPEDRFEFAAHAVPPVEEAPAQQAQVAEAPVAEAPVFDAPVAEAVPAPEPDSVPLPWEAPVFAAPEPAPVVETPVEMEPSVPVTALFEEPVVESAPPEPQSGPLIAEEGSHDSARGDEMVTPSPELFGAESIESAVEPEPSMDASSVAGGFGFAANYERAIHGETEAPRDDLGDSAAARSEAEEIRSPVGQYEESRHEESATEQSAIEEREPESVTAESGVSAAESSAEPESESPWSPTSDEYPEQDIDDALAWEMEIMAAQAAQDVDDISNEWAPAADQFAAESMIDDDSTPEPWSSPDTPSVEIPAAALSFEEIVDDPIPDDGEGSGTPAPAVFITETMAQLYEEQGYLEMAAAVYRQLSEKAPSDDTLRARLQDLERRIAGRTETTNRQASVAADGESAKDFFASLVQVPLRPRLARPYVSMSGEGGDLTPASMAETSPARQATNALSLASVFRNGNSRSGMGGVASGFSFDNFFAAGGQAPPTGGTAEKEPRTRRRRGEDSEEIEQFNSWLEGLKRS